MCLRTSQVTVLKLVFFSESKKRETEGMRVWKATEREQKLVEAELEEGPKRGNKKDKRG